MKRNEMKSAFVSVVAVNVFVYVDGFVCWFEKTETVTVTVIVLAATMMTTTRVAEMVRGGGFPVKSVTVTTAMLRGHQ